jgi:uncharacterized protein YqeY
VTLKEQIQTDMKVALRAGERPRLGCIRLILAAIKQREVDERISLDDTQTLAVLEKMAKQRRESIEQFAAAGREDLKAAEEAELEWIRGYLPEPLKEEALESLIAEAIAETGAASMRDMGAVMGIVKARAQGRADMSEVSRRVKARLGA